MPTPASCLASHAQTPRQAAFLLLLALVLVLSGRPAHGAEERQDKLMGSPHPNMGFTTDPKTGDEYMTIGPPPAKAPSNATAAPTIQVQPLVMPQNPGPPPRPPRPVPAPPAKP